MEFQNYRGDYMNSTKSVNFEYLLTHSLEKVFWIMIRSEERDFFDLIFEEIRKWILTIFRKPEFEEKKVHVEDMMDGDEEGITLHKSGNQYTIEVSIKPQRQKRNFVLSSYDQDTLQEFESILSRFGDQIAKSEIEKIYYSLKECKRSERRETEKKFWYLKETISNMENLVEPASKLYSKIWGGGKDNQKCGLYCLLRNKVEDSEMRNFIYCPGEKDKEVVDTYIFGKKTKQCEKRAREALKAFSSDENSEFCQILLRDIRDEFKNCPGKISEFETKFKNWKTNHKKEEYYPFLKDRTSPLLLLKYFDQKQASGTIGKMRRWKLGKTISNLPEFLSEKEFNPESKKIEYYKIEEGIYKDFLNEIIYPLERTIFIFPFKDPTEKAKSLEIIPIKIHKEVFGLIYLYFGKEKENKARVKLAEYLIDLVKSKTRDFYKAILSDLNEKLYGKIGQVSKKESEKEFIKGLKKNLLDVYEELLLIEDEEEFKSECGYAPDRCIEIAEVDPDLRETALIEITEAVCDKFKECVWRKNEDKKEKRYCSRVRIPLGIIGRIEFLLPFHKNTIQSELIEGLDDFAKTISWAIENWNRMLKERVNQVTNFASWLSHSIKNEIFAYSFVADHLCLAMNFLNKPDIKVQLEKPLIKEYIDKFMQCNSDADRVTVKKNANMFMTMESLLSDAEFFKYTNDIRAFEVDFFSEIARFLSGNKETFFSKPESIELIPFLKKIEKRVRKTEWRRSASKLRIEKSMHVKKYWLNYPVNVEVSTDCSTMTIHKTALSLVVYELLKNALNAAYDKNEENWKNKSIEVGVNASEKDGWVELKLINPLPLPDIIDRAPEYCECCKDPISPIFQPNKLELPICFCCLGRRKKSEIENLGSESTGLGLRFILFLLDMLYRQKSPYNSRVSKWELQEQLAEFVIYIPKNLE
ncbi:MAG: hypothetical protein K8T10_15845 [Candidatus Eremiobacteraeota bacterium]|nr:hypothetical protein [Candidatus Eremiobacteraeota bacterium]